MMSKNYLVLRNPQFNRPRSPFSGTRGFSLAGASGITEPPEPLLSVESLNKNELKDIGRDPEVVGMAPIMPVKLVAPLDITDELPEDEGRTTWGVEITGADKSEYTGNGVTVAVLDTGIDSRHEAFQGVEIMEKDFVGEGNGDLEGHGTHCAGTIFGQPKDNFRYSIAPGVKRALIGKVLDKNGSGGTDHIFNAILWAMDQGAHVISMSLGFDFPGQVKFLVENQDLPADFATSQALEAYRTNLDLFDKLTALVQAKAAFGQGTILVAAAGNESKRNIHKNYEITVAPPAAATDIISVGAVGQVKQKPGKIDIADFSNTGPIVCAPGIKIVSAKLGGGFTSMNGTSMATPHVAGIAALWAEQILESSPVVSPTVLAARVIGQAVKNDFVDTVDAADIGAGLVQAP